MDFDAAPTDFVRMCPPSVGVHGRLLHAPGYAHRLSDRAGLFHLLEETVHCLANSGADVVGQVGTNWVHAAGTDAADIRRFTAEMSEKYETPFHMAGLTLVEACEAHGYERVALNAVYFWPDWRDGVVRFPAQCGHRRGVGGELRRPGLVRHPGRGERLRLDLPRRLGAAVVRVHRSASAGRGRRAGQWHVQLPGS